MWETMGGAIIGYKLEQTRGFVLLVCFLMRSRMNDYAEVVEVVLIFEGMTT